MAKKKVNIHIKVSEEMKIAIDQLADQGDITTSQLVREALQEKVRQTIPAKPRVSEKVVVSR